MKMRENVVKENVVNLKAPGNWINDPNGFIYYGGQYHLFYQYFPYAPFWGTMHWGHAISEDLVHWEHLGVALAPTKEYDCNGVFSGSALEKDGKLYLYYTAVVYAGERPDNIHLSIDAPGKQSQAMLISDDGISFDNFNRKKQIIPVITDTQIADPADCRDPKVWKQGDRYYMCLASTHEKEEGVLVLFRSPDGENWTYFNRLQSSRFGYLLECPDLFEVDGKFLLVCSPILGQMEKGGYDSQAVLIPVKFDPETGEVDFDGENQFLDYGFDLYAPQSNLDEHGRRVILFWARMRNAMAPSTNSAAAGKPWNGMMAIPRVIELREGTVYTVPHPNIRAYYESEECIRVADGRTQMYCGDHKCRITTTIAEGKWLNVKGYRIGLIDGHIVGDRSGLVPENVDIHRISKTPYVGESCELEIYYDPDLIEIFVDGGRYVLSHVTYRNSI